MLPPDQLVGVSETIGTEIDCEKVSGIITGDLLMPETANFAIGILEAKEKDGYNLTTELTVDTSGQKDVVSLSSGEPSNFQTQQKPKLSQTFVFSLNSTEEKPSIRISNFDLHSSPDQITPSGANEQDIVPENLHKPESPLDNNQLEQRDL